MKGFIMNTAEAIIRTLGSTAIPNRNLEDANIVDVVASLASATFRLSDSVTPNVPGTQDASGGHVASLTEAVMGMTRGLYAIADAIEHLAQNTEKCK